MPSVLQKDIKQRKNGLSGHVISSSVAGGPWDMEDVFGRTCLNVLVCPADDSLIGDGYQHMDVEFLTTACQEIVEVIG